MMLTLDDDFETIFGPVMADKVWRCSHCGMQRTQEQKPDRAGCTNDAHGHHSWSLIQW